MKSRIPQAILKLCSWVLLTAPLGAQSGMVLSHQKISDTEGGFTGDLDNEDTFGRAMVGVGDLDGDGIGDIAVGAPEDDDGGLDKGAVWILFLRSDGTVKAHQKISAMEGNFPGSLSPGAFFGWSLSSLGDLDGDGTHDLAVGTPFQHDGGPDRGAVWILFLNPDGTVRSSQKISDTAGGFSGSLEDYDGFGLGIGTIDDLDGDGVVELAVGYADDDSGQNHGAVFILFLHSDGTVKAHQNISETEGGFTGSLDTNDYFGIPAACLGDLDGDGIADMAVGAHLDDDGGSDRGAIWVLFLNADGSVKAHRKISDTVGGFTGGLANEDWFGISLSLLVVCGQSSRE